MTQNSILPTYSKNDKLFVVLTTCLLMADAQAYLDPGTGTMILQGIVAGIVGGFMAIKMGWFRIKSFFPGSKSSTRPDDVKASDEASKNS